VAWHLGTRLTATLDALRDGIITCHKAEAIVWATRQLDADETRKAEAKVVGRAGRRLGMCRKPLFARTGTVI